MQYVHVCPLVADFGDLYIKQFKYVSQHGEHSSRDICDLNQKRKVPKYFPNYSLRTEFPACCPSSGLVSKHICFDSCCLSLANLHHGCHGPAISGGNSICNISPSAKITTFFSVFTTGCLLYCYLILHLSRSYFLINTQRAQFSAKNMGLGSRQTCWN